MIPYLTTSFGDTPFDAIIDAVGIQDVFNASPAFLAEGKPYVTVGPKAYNYTYVGMLGTIGTMVNNIVLAAATGRYAETIRSGYCSIEFGSAGRVGGYGGEQEIEGACWYGCWVG